MSISIAHSRQQLSSLIALAQQQPQFITNRNKPVAVLVSADYFARNQVAAQTDARSLFDRVQGLRKKFAPLDETGLDAVKSFPDFVALVESDRKNLHFQPVDQTARL